MVEIDTLFQTKTAEKPYPFKRGTYLYSLYKGLPTPPPPPPPPPGAKNALQIMSLAAYASETNSWISSKPISFVFSFSYLPSYD